MSVSQKLNSQNKIQTSNFVWTVTGNICNRFVENKYNCDRSTISKMFFYEKPQGCTEWPENDLEHHKGQR